MNPTTQITLEQFNQYMDGLECECFLQLVPDDIDAKGLCYRFNKVHLDIPSRLVCDEFTHLFKDNDKIIWMAGDNESALETYTRRLNAISIFRHLVITYQSDIEWIKS